ncbi:MAG: protein arginine kinase [Bacillota bacterium]
MSIKRILLDIPRWMQGEAEESDIVLSSRVRLARNMVDLPFPHLMTAAQAETFLQRMAEAVQYVNQDDLISQHGPMVLYRVADITNLERQALVEKHLISPQLATGGQNRGLVISEDEVLSVMINEEDHLRIQCLFAGLQLEAAWQLASSLDDALENRLEFAFQEQEGYLTACPTNVGTGLRASVMMHIPALVMTKQAERILSALGKVGLVVRGIYGEGTQALGNVIQVSNQVTLGQVEGEIVANLTAAVKQIVAQEQLAREALMTNNRIQMADRIGRAFGILGNSHVISSEEAVRLLSDVRLGIDLGFITGLPASVFDQLLVQTRPGYLQVLAGQELDALERDVRRAQLLQSKLRSGDNMPS